MRIDTISTFPGMFDSVMGESMMKRAREKGLLDFHAYDLRDWTHDRHRTTDDSPYGGGDGLLMKCGPIFECLDDVVGDFGGDRGYSAVSSFEDVPCPTATSPSENRDASLLSRFSWATQAGIETSPENVFSEAPYGSEASSLEAASNDGASIVMMAPQGRVFDDAFAKELSARDRLVFVCGHYEGMDERVYSVATDVVSLGDYVLTSGELAAMVVIDAVVRKLPGVLGAERGAEEESFSDGLLEFPQYTRPAEFRGMRVPEVLLSGHHAQIAEWRREQSLKRTFELRPDLVDSARSRGLLSEADEAFLVSLQSL